MQRCGVMCFPSAIPFSIPFTNSEVERMFSALKVIKTERCTSLITSTPINLMEINPLVPEFKIPAEPINAGDKILRFLVLSYSQNGFSKDFLWYDSDPGGFLVALIRRCVNTMEAMMKTARSVKEDGREVNVSVGCEAEA